MMTKILLVRIRDQIEATRSVTMTTVETRLALIPIERRHVVMMKGLVLNRIMMMIDHLLIHVQGILVHGAKKVKALAKIPPVPILILKTIRSEPSSQAP
jgi:hypothetical protein